MARRRSMTALLHRNVGMRAMSQLGQTPKWRPVGVMSGLP
jgi:hypothetical protein